MTEKEIVEYLKENRTKGVAFAFMPKEVKEWIEYDKNYKKLITLKSLGDWENTSKQDCDDIFAFNVYALDEEVLQEQKGSWVEFEMINNCLFFLKYTNKGGSNVSRSFLWHQWSNFLEYCDLNNLSFTAFGGWQYNDCSTWFLTPRINVEHSYQDQIKEKPDYKAKPVVPLKIRFWREAK